jgi:cyclophilin family peptidyl-prolyl cis-trans isomerase
MSPMAVLLAAALFSSDGASAEKAPAAANPKVAFETSLGRFVLELDQKKAPVTVENFLGYVRSGHFDGTIFHRVIPGFMVQGGGFDAQMSQKRTGAPIVNEAKNGLKNDRGTVAMARTNDPNSATAQFFVNTVDNAFLNKAPGNDGYAVFGKVVEGMDVVDRIEKVRTANRGGHQNVPVEPVVVTKASILP